jgi:DNA-binding IclR family transcriptional regulator
VSDSDNSGPKRNHNGRDKQTVQSLSRGLEILDIFSDARTSVSIGEMAEQLGIHKSSASRLAATLASKDYLRLTDARKGTYSLGSRLAVLGPLAAAGINAITLIQPHLSELTRVTGETGHVAVLDDSIAETVVVTDGWHTVRMHSWVGKRSPAHCSSMGKALLSGLREDQLVPMYPGGKLIQMTPKTVKDVDDLTGQLGGIRGEGFALDDEELEEGLRCVAAPVFGPDGSIPFSISISGPTQRITTERIPAVADWVRWSAWKASQALGALTVPEGWPPPPTEQPPYPSWVEHPE